MSIDGATRLFAIIGDPIAQAKSPAILTPLMEQAGANAILIPLHVRQADFDESMRVIMRLGNLDGLTITYPFKERALRHIDHASHRARETGSINAMKRDEDGSWSGDMFDGIGLLQAIQDQTEVAGASILLVGAGGAGRAIGFALAEAGAASLTINDLDTSKAETLALHVQQAYPARRARAGGTHAEGNTIVINATPIGIDPRDYRLPAHFGPLSPTMTIVDIVPSQTQTPLLIAAEKAGARQVTGAAMTRGQADAILKFFGIRAKK